jgi:hypothetical protein
MPKTKNTTSLKSQEFFLSNQQKKEIKEILSRQNKKDHDLTSSEIHIFYEHIENQFSRRNFYDASQDSIKASTKKVIETLGSLKDKISESQDIIKALDVDIKNTFDLRLGMDMPFILNPHIKTEDYPAPVLYPTLEVLKRLEDNARQQMLILEENKSNIYYLQARSLFRAWFYSGFDTPIFSTKTSLFIKVLDIAVNGALPGSEREFENRRDTLSKSVKKMDWFIDQKKKKTKILID